MESNKGKGAALNAGANLIEGNIVLLLDADLGSTAIHAAPLLNPVIQKKADMTIAIFPSSGKKDVYKRQGCSCNGGFPGGCLHCQ